MSEPLQPGKPHHLLLPCLGGFIASLNSLSMRVLGQSREDTTSQNTGALLAGTLLVL